MAWKRMVLQIGMGTDIRGADYTKAAVRALRDALWHNSLSVADALGQHVDAMHVEVTIGVPHPERVDKAAVLAILPHGTRDGDRRRGRAGNSQRRRHEFHGDRQCGGGRAAGRAMSGAHAAETRHPGTGQRQRPAWRRLHQGGDPRGAGRDPSQFAEHHPVAGVRFAKNAGRGHHRRAAAGRVDAEAVRAALPHGQVSVSVVKGGLDVPDRRHIRRHRGDRQRRGRGATGPAAASRLRRQTGGRRYNAKRNLRVHHAKIVEYLRHGDRALKLRVFRPRGDGPFPAVIDLHGGAWCNGDLNECKARDEVLAASGLVAIATGFPPRGGRLSDLADRHQLRDPLGEGERGEAGRAGRPDRAVAGNRAAGIWRCWRRCGRAIRAMRRSAAGRSPAVDATVRCVAMTWPVINPLSRYRHARRARDTANPPAWVGNIPERHDTYWKTEAKMAEGNPVLALERGEKVHDAAGAVGAGPAGHRARLPRSGVAGPERAGTFRHRLPQGRRRDRAAVCRLCDAGGNASHDPVTAFFHRLHRLPPSRAGESWGGGPSVIPPASPQQQPAQSGQRLARPIIPIIAHSAA